MKRYILILLLATSTAALYGQTETAADTLGLADGATPPMRGAAIPEGTHSVDGFLIDMRGLMDAPAPDLSSYRLTVPDASKDYSRLFRLSPDVTYSSGLSHMFSTGGTPYYTRNPFGLTGFGFGGAADNLQMGSFRLRNGWRLNTYGEYDKDGRRVYNPSALPWQRNNFKGAFELKSQDGKFGIRVEVQRGRENPF